MNFQFYNLGNIPAGDALALAPASQRLAHGKSVHYPALEVMTCGTRFYSHRRTWVYIGVIQTIVLK
jgi:hypothetical protein